MLVHGHTLINKAGGDAVDVPPASSYLTVPTKANPTDCSAEHLWLFAWGLSLAAGAYLAHAGDGFKVA